MSAEKPSRTLAEELRGWPDERLLDLLRLRPDLATPAPVDSGQLASRAATRSSLLRALDLLDATELLVLDALVVAGQTTLADLTDIVHAEPARVTSAVRRLRDLALVWEAPGGLRALSGVADGVRGAGSGLTPRSADPAPTDEILRVLAGLSERARALLDHVDANGGEGRTEKARRNVTADQVSTPVEELLAHGLLRPHGDDAVRIPGEVGLALRGGRTTSDPIDDVPELATSARDAALVDRVAAGAAFETVRRVELLGDHWGVHPPGALRNGGLGVRDLRASAELLHVEEAVAALLVEVAHAAGLIALGQDTDSDPAWMPTDAFDAWTTQPAARRWARLADAWLRTHRTPGRVGTRDQAGRTLNALVPELSSPLAEETRRATLAALGELPAGSTLAAGTGPASLARLLEFRRPRRPSTRRELVAATLSEAAVLGVTGLDGLSGHGRALLEESTDAAATTLEPLLPEPVDHVLVQADLTAVAPGPLESHLARTLQLIADVESRGGATVYRFTPASVRRALDVGWTGPEVHEFLGSVSRTPLPQPLIYLVEDTVRTFGSIRVGVAEAFLRADDETALTELLRHPRAEGLGLRRIAPTVLISTTPIEVLLPRLRELGAAPVVEGPDGTVRVARPDLLRARNPRDARSSGLVAAREAAHATSVVSAIRAGDRAAADRPARTTSTTTPMDALVALREAVETGSVVVIGYVDNQGTSTERVVDPQRVEGGWLTAHDHRSADVRRFAVHRIVSVRQLQA